MARRYRTEPEVDQLWEEFHSWVNLNSGQLRSWLMTRGSGEDGFSDAKLNMDSRSAAIMQLLGKRKVDLTNDDIEMMAEVVDEIRALKAHPPAKGASNDEWRRALLDLGHDPLREPRKSAYPEDGLEPPQGA
ncbi:MAG TPA: DUF3140 domain-containing protein [Micromonospora sp.]